jgi:chromosome segregation ATPase
MNSGKATTVKTTARPACKYPGCGQPAAPAENPGRPPEYCAGRGHTRVSAWRERRRLTAEKNGTTISAADDAGPVTMAKMTGAELLRSLRAEADRVAALGTDLRDRIDVLADPTAAEAEVEAVRAAAEQRAATAEAKAADAERRAAEADRFRAEADAAAEQMSEELTAAQDRATAAEQRAQAAEADRDAAVAKARADADERVAAAQAERDTAITQARADASARVRDAEAERDAAQQAAANTEAAARQAQQETARAQAAAEAAQAETGRVRADAERALDQARADAAREREELRADLCARAERAERQADAYRGELDQVRVTGSSGDLDAEPAGPPAKTARRGTRTQAAQPRQATGQ